MKFIYAALILLFTVATVLYFLYWACVAAVEIICGAVVKIIELYNQPPVK
jgi:hypothetical protein